MEGERSVFILMDTVACHLAFTHASLVTVDQGRIAESPRDKMYFWNKASFDLFYQHLLSSATH